MKKKRAVPVYLIILWIITGIWIMISFLIPYIHPIDLGDTDLINRYAMPSIFGISDSGFLLGADYLGRDILIRLLYATRTTFVIAFSGLISSSILGITMGMLAGVCGGFVDEFIMFLVSLRSCIPGIVIGIAISTVFGSTTFGMWVLITIVYSFGYVRQTRAQVLQVKNECYIECSRAIGASTFHIIKEHVLRNIAPPLIVIVTGRLSGIILYESSLSFLGLGIQAPNTSLGVMVNAGREQMILQWWQAIIPTTVIVFVVLTVTLTGDWLSDKLDPKLKMKS